MTRRVAVRALAKINLDLRVLGKRADGFHELRTIFQTISLADRIAIAFTPGRKTAIAVDGAPDIPDNLMVRAAELALQAMGARGRVEMQLDKRIPMGAGLGGGSSDAAAVLLALPVLAGKPLTLPALCALGEQLGSDVPFFLLGGRAAGIGRGTELFPLPDAARAAGLLIAPGIHVNTAQAYRDLSPRLTIELQQNKIVSFQKVTWQAGCPAARGEGAGAGGWGVETPVNDFESVVFEQHAGIGELKRKLMRAGAFRSMMTGSGSAVFGLFPSREAASRARTLLKKEEAFPISLVGRARYRAMWWRQLAAHIDQKSWPPRSRYSR
jgi:4-diphosphocytidyl-2-C-methyl-D-erythritol kinase